MKKEQAGKIKDLNSCLTWIHNVIKIIKSKGEYTGIESWLKLTEDDAVCSTHLTSGMSTRNELNLWGDNTFTKWFNSKGIYHADDMSGIIYISLHRKLNKKDINLEEQIKYYQDYWEKLGVDPKPDHLKK